MHVLDGSYEGSWSESELSSHPTAYGADLNTYVCRRVYPWLMQDEVYSNMVTSCMLCYEILHSSVHPSADSLRM